MKKYYFKGIMALVIMVLGLNCLGKVVKKRTNLDGVSEIALKCEGVLYLKQGNENLLTTEVDHNFSSKLNTSTKGKTLSLDIKRSWMGSNSPKILNYYVTLKSVESIANNSSGKLKITSDIKSKNLVIKCTSSGSIETQGKIEGNNVSINLSSSGNIYIAQLNSKQLEVVSSSNGNIEIASGFAEDQVIKVTSSGDYNAKGLNSKKADVNNSSSGDVYLKTKEITSQISSKGNVEVFGKPLTTNSQSTSTGKLIVHQ